MDWQEVAVGLIGAGAVVRLLFLLRRKRRGGCASCGRECPYRETPERKRGE